MSFVGEGGAGGVVSGRSLVRLWLAVLLFFLVAAAAARGADRVYWTDDSPGAIRVGNLDGIGSAQNLGTYYASESYPDGVAIDLAAGKIYWANSGTTSSNGAIRVGNLDGSGSPQTLYAGESNADGLAIDPAAGKIYWIDEGPKPGTGTVRVGNLDGSGSPQTLYASENSPDGVAIDPAAGKIYWTDDGTAPSTGAIRVGNLDGIGSAQNLGTNYASENYPGGVAIDPAAGKIYWANSNSGAIRVGNLDGDGSPQNLGTKYTSENDPGGVAIDPAAGKIYWIDHGTMPSSGAIRVGSLDGSGSPQTLYAGEDDPESPDLLRAPAGAGAPTVTGAASIGSTLSCSQGQWAPDLLGAFLYRAPQSFSYQWSRGGSVIPGATSSTITASTAGSYSCQVTATNTAGAASQTSAPVTVPAPRAKIEKAKISSKHHGAKFTFKAAGASGFQCALVKRLKAKKKKHKHPKPHFSRCKSPKTYKHLKPGRYTFMVRALSAGIPGTPATKNFKIS